MTGVAARGKPSVVWFTGLSGSGKTTLAHAVARKLEAEGETRSSSSTATRSAR